MLKNKNKALENKKAFYGRMFVLPWVFGFVLFFFVPLIESVIFAFSKVSLTPSGFELIFKGLKNFKYIFLEDSDYTDRLVAAFGNFAYTLPFIVIFSLILAVLLNQKFKGRLFFRSVFFMPVIISTGIVMTFILGDDVAVQMRSADDQVSTLLGVFIDVEEVMTGLGLPQQIIELLIKYVEEIFNLLWCSGIQILLFVSGLQAIPEQLYEVSRVEGATSWETFWYVTFPMLGNTLVLVFVFTAIDILTSTDNAIMSSAFSLMQNQVYDTSSAMIWSYFILVIAVIVVVYMLINHFCLRKWEK